MKRIINESQLRSIIKSCANMVITEAKNKRSVINKFYKFISPFTQSRFHDAAWENVRHILDKIGEWADDLNVHVENGGYGQSRDGLSKFKDYQIELLKDGVELKGYLRANACGSNTDEWDAYDVTITVW